MTTAAAVRWHCSVPLRLFYFPSPRTLTYPVPCDWEVKGLGMEAWKRADVSPEVQFEFVYIIRTPTSGTESIFFFSPHPVNQSTITTQWLDFFFFFVYIYVCVYCFTCVYSMYPSMVEYTYNSLLVNIKFSLLIHLFYLFFTGNIITNNRKCLCNKNDLNM